MAQWPLPLPTPLGKLMKIIDGKLFVKHILCYLRSLIAGQVTEVRLMGVTI